jgi:methionyl-tRNA synthetase
MSAGLPVPRQIVSHGWWLRDAKKMSKSTGNVVRPDDLVAAFGVDALRWHLVSAMSFGQDANFSDEDFLAGYNADLANGLGNTLSRAVKMSRDFFGGKTPPVRRKTTPGGPLVFVAAQKAGDDWKNSFEGYRLQDAAAAIRYLLGAIDAEITATEPWKALRQPPLSSEELFEFRSHVLYDCLEALRVAACMLAPIAPRTATEVFRRLGTDKRAEDLRASDLAWGLLPLDAPLPAAPPLFPRADAKEYFASRGAGTAGASKESSVADTKENISPSKQIPPSSPETKISIDDFLKIDLRVGEVIAAEKVEKSKKLMKMTVRIGEEVRTIVGGIATAYTAEQLVGRKLVFVANLAPAKLMGIESNGMVLAATLPETGEASLLAVDPSVPSGAKVK